MKRTLKVKEGTVKSKQQKALADLAYIKHIIEDSERVFVDHGLENILWGTMVAFAQMLTYFLVRDDRCGTAVPMTVVIAIWAVTLGVLWALIVMVCRNRFNRTRVKTFAGRMFLSIWTGTGIAIAISIFVILFSHVINPYLIDPIVALFLGVAYYCNSMILSSRWMKILAFGWWIGAIPMFLYPSDKCFIIFSVMILVLAIIPGIIFYRRHCAAGKSE